jgi:hypothetical protein
MPGMDRRILWRSGAIQLVAVGVLSAILAVLLPKSYFDDWGWLTGPAAWLACAALTARLLRLAVGPTLLGAVLAGVPSAIAVLLGVHWLGVVVAIAIFAVWCGRLPATARP